HCMPFDLASARRRFSMTFGTPPPPGGMTVEKPDSAARFMPATPVGRRELLSAGLAVTAGALAAGADLARAAEAAAPAPADSRATDAKLLPGFRVERVKTSGADIYTVIGGSGPP